MSLIDLVHLPVDNNAEDLDKAMLNAGIGEYVDHLAQRNPFRADSANEASSA